MKILDVRRIAFHGQTGDNRSPEDFAFPAAITSMMEYLGEDMGVEIMRAHDTDWMHRAGNDAFAAASGIGFALLWDRSLCAGAMDLLQAGPYDRGIDNAFRWAGWSYKRVSGEDMKSAAAAAIAAEKPFIALGLTDVPEAALVCGCDESGDTLFGWSHFQDGMKTIENGMFVSSGWTERTWEIIVPDQKTGRSADLRHVLSEGVRIMTQTDADGYCAGQAAYDAWIAALEASEGADRALFDYHHAILFNMAEARCWCGEFLKKQGVEAGKRFKAIHDLCWKADAAVNSAADLADGEKKKALISVLREIQAEERAAVREIGEYLKK